MKPIVPPGGFAGFAQQTPATQRLFQAAGRKGGTTTARRRRTSTKKRTANGKQTYSNSTTVTRRPNRAKTRALRLKKGSAAAKAYMARLRRKIKKTRRARRRK